mmetsp:Transcript_31520/g.71214  ORF Transcript_31520/g.71214 Transcript_31520/m.71214 type:complete len:91 (-) Transcript_31520:113-385(-)
MLSVRAQRCLRSLAIPLGFLLRAHMSNATAACGGFRALLDAPARTPPGSAARFHGMGFAGATPADFSGVLFPGPFAGSGPVGGGRRFWRR